MRSGRIIPEPNSQKWDHNVRPLPDLEAMNGTRKLRFYYGRRIIKLLQLCVQDCVLLKQTSKRLNSTYQHRDHPPKQIRFPVSLADSHRRTD